MSILEIESVLHNIATVHCLIALVLSIPVLTPCWGQRFTPNLFGANIFKNSKSLLNYLEDTCYNHIREVRNKELKIARIAISIFCNMAKSLSWCVSPLKYAVF